MQNKLTIFLFVLSTTVLVACATVGSQERTLFSAAVEPDNSISPQNGYPENVIRVTSLNLAHGRKDSFNQLFLKTSTIKKNLDDIAAVLKQQKPHIVALQEADAESFWSGSFDHVKYLARQAHYPWSAHAINADGWFFSYGTAILSALPVTETIKYTFESSPPTLNKGFTLAQINWKPEDGKQTRKIDVISVHLDFSRKSVRIKQIDEMKEVLSSRMNPTIIMGDFNSEWLAEASGIYDLATNSRFVAYEPESTDLNTYKDKRLDWILITRDMEFVDYRVLSETLSDHSAIMADIRFKDIATIN